MKDSSIFFAASHKFLFQYQHHQLMNVTASINGQEGDFSIHLNKQSIWVILHVKALKEYEYKQDHLVLKQAITH